VAQWDLSTVNQNRRKFLAQLGQRSTNQALQRIAPERRYPILLAFLHQMLEEIVDEAIDLFDGCLADAERRARRAREAFHASIAQATNEKLRLFQEVGSIVLDTAIPDDQVRAQIYGRVPPGQLQAEVADCQRLVRPHATSAVDFFVQRYQYLRQFAPAFLDTFSFRSSQPHDPLLEAVSRIRELNAQGKSKIPVEWDMPLAFVRAVWHPYVMKRDGTLERHAYELCVLWELRNALRAGNVWLEGSRRYADPESYLIPRERWPGLRSEVCQLLDLPFDGRERLQQRQTELEARLASFDRGLTRNSAVRLENGNLVVTRLEAEHLPEQVARLQQQIGERLPQVDLAEQLIEVDRWTHFSDCFEHAGGSEPRTVGLQVHLYAAILAQACNLGLTQMAQISDLSYRQLAWCTNWYLREETLRSAIAAVVNYHHRLPLSQIWGDGTLSSSDGQRFPVSVKARNATALPRYFGYGRGLTFYSWTSNQHNQYGTKVTPTTARDSPYVLDEILDNETELAIVEHTTDTSGYTEILFALFDLLGLQFSPRISDIGSQQLYRIDRTPTYRHIEPLLKGSLQVERILRRWDDLVRVAGSLKLGWVTASLFISKLLSFARQNALAQALQEYGRLTKTLFILHYLESEEYRRRIQVQLNKGESLHALRQFLMFGNEGKIRRRQLEEQTNQASCLTLVTNAVITWNTVYMAAAIEQLRTEGYTIADADITHLSPARYEHINRYGKYQFNVEEILNRQELRPLRKPESA
jgi:TnpA family transposase